MACEFLISHHIGASAVKQVPCGADSARYRCEGDSAAIVMELCDRHKAFCEQRYHWSVTAWSQQEVSTEAKQTTKTQEE